MNKICNKLEEILGQISMRKFWDKFVEIFQKFDVTSVEILEKFSLKF